MCGIIGIVRRRTTRAVPTAAEILGPLDQVGSSLPQPTATDLAAVLSSGAGKLAAVDVLLQGEAGLRAFATIPGLADSIKERLAPMSAAVAAVEAYLDSDADELDNLEAVNAAMVLAKDALWAIERDRVRTAAEVLTLAGENPSGAALAGFLSVQQALSNLDRLEVRGRDSAGIHLLVRGHNLDLESGAVKAVLDERTVDGLFQSRSVRVADGHLSFVYKAAAEIGELGDNTAHMRAEIMADELLHQALRAETAEVTVLGHTRWASVGIISEPNAHPVNSDEVGTVVGPYVTATLNGDVDNFADLIVADRLEIAGEITTDAKVIPSMTSRAIAEGHDLDEAVRRTVAQFEGSVAIGLSSASAPADLHLALRGSGQGVFVGLSEDCFVVASEPYGVVEDAASYLRMDGESAANPDNVAVSQGQIVRLSGALAGDPAGVTRLSYDGTELPIEANEWKAPSVTTRDIDRGDSPHFLLKEISESPNSFRKTLRGRLHEENGRLEVRLPAETLSESIRKRIESGAFQKIEVIGQGTAAVAGQAVAAAFEWALGESKTTVRAITATELSGFNLRDDMSDTLIVAISQSGTTTDTNRTIDLARSRGAVVLAIVNRRGSDLVDKSDGVLFTSDGRDVEMSVASTKAFYAQIAAGFLLATGVAGLMPDVVSSDAEIQALLRSLRNLPEAMTATIAKRPEIAAAASRHAPSRRYWAMVGNGANLVAAREIRIKLSELCYKSIACDVTEDKKHIDLSSEPLILVCAAGLTGSNADDVAKEVAIFRAHKAAPIVIATEGENRFNAALDVIGVPDVHPQLAFVLSTVVGHLFGYEAALAIDASANHLRLARGAIEHYVGASGDEWFTAFGDELAPHAERFFDTLRTGAYNGHLEASTATRLAALLRFSCGWVPFDAYQIEFGKVGTPGVIVEDLASALTSAIEELTRPIDAIKHQAKTVTVGISRADESLLQAELIQSILGIGCPRDRMSYKTLRTLSALSPAIDEIVGYTRYGLDGSPQEDGQLHIVDRGGLATHLTSRVERDPRLRGTKRRVAVEKTPLVSVGSDGRIVLIVPEVKDGEATGLTLCHLKLVEGLSVSATRSLLQGYRNRYAQLVDVVTESEPVFREDLLADIPTVDLLTAPISDVAARWAQ